jgi:hypothetical protein
MNIEREIHHKIAILSCTSSSAGCLRRPTTGLGQSGSVNLGGRAARQLRIGPPHCRLRTRAGSAARARRFRARPGPRTPSMVGGVQITAWSSPSREPSLPIGLRHYRFDPRDASGRHPLRLCRGGLPAWRTRLFRPNRLALPRQHRAAMHRSWSEPLGMRRSIVVWQPGRCRGARLLHCGRCGAFRRHPRSG